MSGSEHLTGPANVTDGITRQALVRTDATAVIAGGLRLSFGELDAAVRRGAGWLARQGLSRGARVGLCFSDRVTHLVTMLALARSGIGQIALTAADPESLRRATAHRLQLVAVLGDSPAAADVGLPVAEPDREHMLRGPDAGGPAPAATQPTDTWIVCRSSGSTGAPKFALVTHGMGIARLRNDMALLPYRPDDRFFSMVTLDFAVAQQRVTFCLAAGGCVCLPSGPGDTLALAELVARERVTYLAGVPLHADALVSRYREAAPLLAGLRVMRIGAAHVAQSLHRQVTELLTPNLYVNYGSNETNTIAVASPLDRAQVPDTVGRPAPNIQVQVVDRQGRVLPAGEIGLVRVRGPNVVAGYVDDPEADARAFVGGWFLPGDVGRFTDTGSLVLQGRADDMMIFDGINIYPVEIENGLRLHPAVVDAQAFPLPERHRNQVPAAAVVTRGPVDEAELMGFARMTLGVKAPRAILVVEEFPRNAMGKVLKKQCAELLLAKLRERRGR